MSLAELLLVHVSIWLASLAWLAGSCFRLLSAHAVRNGRAFRPNGQALASAYACMWLAGVCLLIIHIVASYGFAYGWSHRAAIQATAEDAFQTTGIRAGWGVYVNFLFAVIWLFYSIEILRHGIRNETVDKSIYAFSLAMFSSATIVFETGILRYFAITAFLFLFGMHFRLKTL